MKMQLIIKRTAKYAKYAKREKEELLSVNLRKISITLNSL